MIVTNLKDQVCEFVKYDAALLGPQLNAEKAPYDGTASYWAASGARFEHSRLSPLLELLPDIVGALEKLTASARDRGVAKGRGDWNFTISSEDWVEAIETLVKIKEAVEGTK